MNHFIITITEQNGSTAEAAVEHYRRRVETEDIGFIIGRLGQSLNVKPRRKRCDAGKSRSADTQGVLS